MPFIGRLAAMPNSHQQNKFIAGVDRGMDAFGQHCGAAGNARHNKFACRNGDIRHDRGVNHLVRSGSSGRLAFPLLLVRTSAWSMYAFAVIFGLGLGGEYLIIPLMAGELFGISVLGRVMGIVLTADGVAEATAPMLVGSFRDRFGSYDTGFLLLVGAALVGAAAIALLPHRRLAATQPNRLAPSP